MTNKKCNDLIFEIGGMIVGSERYQDCDWISLAVVGNFSHNQQRQNGYVYRTNNSFEALAPGFDTLRKIRELREEMAKEKGQYWHQCLIHITKPDMKINIQFEYDDPDRWSLKKVSLDMREYAESLKPPMPSDSN